MADEQKLEKAGWKRDGNVWKRGNHSAERAGFGWMIWLGQSDNVWNDTGLPRWALTKKTQAY